jgi:predicted nucleic-acid-binding Zn-ribbon protein
MTDSDNLIFSLVQKVFGKSKNSSKSWQNFNCITSQVCRLDHDKYNLAYSVTGKQFKCWKCGYRAYIKEAIRDFGTQEDLDRLDLILPKYENKPLDGKLKKRPTEEDYTNITCPLPNEYFPLSIERETSLYKQALEYVTKERKISLDDIDKYKIGYTESGNYKYRIILPGINKLGNTNYFEARLYIKGSKMATYQKPDSKFFPGINIPGSSEIIFDEFYINWELPVYLCESVLDARKLPNGLAMLGKTPNDLIISMLLKHNCKFVVAMDTDATKDAIRVYKMLTSLGLDGYILDLQGHKDISKIYEDFGKDKLIEIVKNGIRKISEIDELNNILNE